MGRIVDLHRRSPGQNPNPITFIMTFQGGRGRAQAQLRAKAQGSWIMSLRLLPKSLEARVGTICWIPTVGHTDDVTTTSAPIIGTAVVLTALQVEHDAVRARMRRPGSLWDPLGGVYTLGTFETSKGDWRVALACVGAGNIPAALAAGDAITSLNPDFICFLGVAGGVKDVNLGDVVVASKVYGYERGKDYDNEFIPTPAAIGISHSRLVAHFNAEALSGAWVRRITKNDKSRNPGARMLVAPIAAGEKVVKSDTGGVASTMRRYFNDVVAVEMEGLGVLAAAAHRDNRPAIVVRGISDGLSGKTGEQDFEWQPIASRNAAAAFFAALKTLDPEWLSGGARVPVDASRLAPSLLGGFLEEIQGNLQESDKTVDFSVEGTRKNPGQVGSIFREFRTNGHVSSSSGEVDEIPSSVEGNSSQINTTDLGASSRSASAGAFPKHISFHDVLQVAVGHKASVYSATARIDGVTLGKVALKVWDRGAEDRCHNEVRWSSAATSLASWKCFGIQRLEEDPFGGGVAAMSPWYGDETALDYMRSQGPDLVEVKRLWLQMSEVLEELYESGVVHGDVKPSNIMFGNGQWTLIDYGIAGRAGATDGIRGTPAYMAPESFEQRRHPLSDVYSLARTIEDCLHGTGSKNWNELIKDPSSLKVPGKSGRSSSGGQVIPESWSQLLDLCLQEANRRPIPMELTARIKLLETSMPYPRRRRAYNKYATADIPNVYPRPEGSSS